ncbi:MAG: hypothetical protein E3J72_20575 [Planctomycetota bacterium]|nr:MAG: hypothetical protein E3J72_20575 [Planctomycetota bacterium]
MDDTPLAVTGNRLETIMNEKKDPQPEAMARLEEMLRIFNETTAKLEATQAALQDKVRELQSELAEKNRLLARKNRLAALGEIAAGVAHEIRNPLGGIGLYADMLAGKLEGNPSLAVVEKIQRGVRTLNDLVEKLLLYTSGVTADFGETDLNLILDEAFVFAAAEIEKAGIIVNRPDPGESFPIVADEQLIMRAFLNVILNAVQAMGKDGELTVNIGLEGDEKEGAYIITLTDNGPGIPQEELDRIFDPFFTTRSGGTGLGLAITAGCVDAHRGRIKARNTAEGGAQFVFILPCRPDRIQAEDEE